MHAQSQSTPLQKLRDQQKRGISDLEMVQQMLLLVDEVQMWTDHTENVARAQKLGAEMAAATITANRIEKAI